MIVPVILAGGSGTRLWPLSRQLYPKQLLRLGWEHTLLQQTVLRLDGAENVGAPIVIVNQTYRFIISRQLAEIGARLQSLVLEPAGRSTAPAVAVAAMMAADTDPDAMILVLPADHLIPDTEKFRDAIRTARCFAAINRLVTFGVVPRTPETGYGYIRKGAPVFCGNDNVHEAFGISEFVEKPDLPSARQYVESGKYCWNAGMFMFTAVEIIREMEQLCPEIVDACRRSVEKGSFDGDAFMLDISAFSGCPADSIDYAVMEKTKRGVMVPFAAGWNDVGSWDAIWELSPRDADNNVVKGDVVNRNNRGCLVFAESRLVAAAGMENAVIIETPDAVLVTRRGRGQEVKKVVDGLNEEGRPEAAGHGRMVYPWGSVQVEKEDDRTVIRRVTLNGGAEATVHTPPARVLHWIVIEGEGLLQRPQEALPVRKNAAVRIEGESMVRIINSGDETLDFMEFYLSGNGKYEHFKA